jgi:hypothetical protein
MASGIGAFATNFMSSFGAARHQKLLKEQLAARQQSTIDHEKRMADQFTTQQQFRESQAAALEKYRQTQLGNQEEAAKALETYRTGQMDLEQKKFELQKRNLDMEATKTWKMVLDPTLGKPQRKFMFKQFSKSLGIDPKSQEYKDFEGMITGMDDENLKETYSNLATMLPHADPGQVVAFSKAIIGGQITMKDAIEEFGKIKNAEQLRSITGGGGEDTGAAGGTGEQAGVPTRQVPTSRITDPTPMARQTGVAPNVRQESAGTLPIPGMATPTGETHDDPNVPEGAQSVDMSPDQAREIAHNLLTKMPEDDNARATATSLLQYARDKTDKYGLAVTVDPNNPDNNVYTVYDKSNPSKALAGKEAPSSRNYPTPQERGRETEAVELAKADVKRLEAWRADAELARSMSVPLQTFKQTMQSGKFVPGTLAGTRETLARAAEFLGLPDSIQEDLAKVGINDAGSAETLNSAAAQITSRLAERMGRVSNMQLEFVKEIGPAAWKTPRGNAMMIDLAERQNARALEIEDVIDSYQRDFGTMYPKGKPSAYDEIKKIRAKPLVDDDWVKQFKAEAKKGQGLDWKSFVDGALKSESLNIGDEKYDIYGQTQFKDDKGKLLGKQFPLIKVEGFDQEMPYVGSLSDKALKDKVKVIPKGTTFWYYDPEEKSVLQGTK